MNAIREERESSKEEYRKEEFAIYNIYILYIYIYILSLQGASTLSRSSSDPLFIECNSFEGFKKSSIVAYSSSRKKLSCQGEDWHLGAVLSLHPLVIAMTDCILQRSNSNPLQYTKAMLYNWTGYPSPLLQKMGIFLSILTVHVVLKFQIFQIWIFLILPSFPKYLNCNLASYIPLPTYCVLEQR